jgi:hypothetical protein
VVFAQSALAVDLDDKTVTSKKYVDTNFQNLTEKDPTTGTAPNDVTSISDSSTNTQYPTSRNVYKFVKQELQEAGATGNMTGNVPKHTQKIAVFENGYNGNATNPTATDLEHLDHWELIVPDDRVAGSAGDISAGGASDATATEQTNLTTAKAVYDFVTYGDPIDPNSNGYQPKATSATPQVGFRTGSGTTADPYQGNWYNLVEGQDGQALSTAHKYVKITTDDGSQPGHTAGVYLDLKKNFIIGSDNPETGDTGYDNRGIGATSSNNLATGVAVYEYAVPMNWTERAPSGYANKKLVTDGSGNVILAEDTTADIPSDMPNECDTASGTHVCALVAYWDATLNNNTGGVKYEWTVMAPRS